MNNGNNEFVLDFLALLDKQKSKSQINANIKELEQSVRKIKLVATLAKGDAKSELNQVIKQLESQLKQIKLQAKIDSRQLNREISNALRNVSARDIQLNITSNGERVNAQVRRVVSQAREFIQRNPISMNIDLKKEKLLNQLTTFTNKHTKINESSYWLGEAERLRGVIGAVTNRDELRNATDQLQVFTSGVRATGYAAVSTTDRIKGMLGNIVKVGNYFGLAYVAVNKFRQSLNTLKTNSSILTEISKTSEMTKQQLKELGDESFKIASKYGQSSGNYLLGVQEMARSGYETLSKELGELSLLTQSAGDMTADMANNYLLATDAAYKYGGSVEKLNAALDGANFISNKNSASLTDIADATRVSASFAANANVAIDELTAAEATMIAVTKRSGSEMGRAFRSILLNLQQVSGEFDGEVISEEDLAKVEARCHSLGVELEYMKDGVATLRDPMEVLRDLAKVYNSLPDNSADKQGLISDIGGKYHANALSALLSRWDMYEKMLGEFSQGTGSALEEANKTADSWEGRLAQLQNSWDSFVNSLTNEGAIKGGVSFLDNTIKAFEKLTDTVGALPVVLTALQTGMSALNKNYGITQIYNKDAHKFDIQGNFMGVNITEYKKQIRHYREAETAIRDWNNQLVNGIADINTFGGAVGENNAQLRAYLQTTSVDAPASLNGYRSFLNAAGESTDALRLRTILMTSALTFGLSFGIQKTIELFSKWANASKVAKENAEAFTASLKETQDTQSTNTSSISGLSEEYADLSSKVDALGGNLHLTSEEYARYHDITNQVADIMPGLIQSYDEQGNAILKLKGKLVDLNSEYDKYKQNEAIKNYNEEDKNGNKKVDSVFKNYRNSQKANTSLSNYFSHFFDSQNELTTNALSDVDLLSYLEELYQMSPEDLLKTRKSVGGGTHGSIIRAILDTYGLDPDSTETEIETVRQNISTQIMSLTTEIENQVSGIGQTAITYAQQSSTYWKDLDEKQRVYISSLFNNLTPDLVDSLNLSEKSSMEAFVNNMVFSLRENKDGIHDAFNELFTFEPDELNLTPEEIKNKIDGIIGRIAETLNTDQNLLKNALGIDYDAIDDLSNDYTEVIDRAVSKFKDTDKEDLEKFFKDNSINTQEEIDRLQEIAEAVDTATELKEQYLTIGEETKPFSQRFQDLWDSESFKDAREELQKLAKEAGITEDDIYSLARENEELSLLLDDSGISAQFAAACFNQVCNGADGFSAITEDALALDQVLHGMDESLQSAAASKSAYDKAMEQDDYDSEFKNYQEAYKSAMEMFENGDYGKHFRSAMEYLLGDKSYTMSIEEMKNAMDGLKNVFGEDATNGLEFLDKLYEKKDVLDGLDSSLEKLSDGSYKFDLKPDEFEAIGEAIGMTADEVAACTNALGMFGDFRSYDMEELEETLNGISIAAKDGEKSILSLQGVETILSDRGYNGYEIYHILEDIKGMGSLELLDFNASDSEGLQTVIDKLSELDMLKINGDSIDVSGLADKLKNTFGMTFEDIQTFLASLGEGFDFTDSMGTDVVDAYSSIQEKIKSIQAEIASGSYSTDEIVQMQTQLEELKRRADALREPVDIKLTSNIEQTKAKLEEVTRKYNELKTSIASKQEQGITVTYGDTNALNELANQKAALEEQLNHYNELKVTVEMEREQADADIKDLTSDKETKLTVNIANKGEVDAQFNQWTQPKSTTLKVNVTANDPNGLLKGGTPTSGQAGNSGNSSSSSPASGTVKALGNAQIGHSFADGTIGAPKTETALINELGNETIIDPESGTYEIVKGGAQFRKIKKGQIILNHLQTQALQKYGKISSFGKMLFGGNAKLKGSSYASGEAGATNPGTKKPYNNNGSSRKPSSSNNSSDSASRAVQKAADTAKEATEEIFDWIERRIKKFQAAFDKWIKQAETAVTSGFINKYYKKATSAIKNELSTYGKAYKRYMKQADSVGLSKKYRDKVKNGTIDIETIKDEKLAEQIKKYQEWCVTYAPLSGNRWRYSI